MPPLSLYIHIPWCVRKCPYCDFNSHEMRQQPNEMEYVDRLLNDLDSDLETFTQRPLHTIFIGGGTPSVFSGPAMARLMREVFARFELEKDAIEVTMEANPGTAEQERFHAYRAAGINRLSVGVQSFAAEQLKVLGRIHSSAEAEAALAMARAAGFTNVNLDLMYALPQQDVAGALADIETAIGLGPEHISHYQLTLEPNTAFAHQPPPLPDDDLAFEMMQTCQKRLAEAGYLQYETSAYAKGERCTHNLNYWQFGDYLGIGAGAHGKVTTATGIVRYRKHKHPRLYQDSPKMTAESYTLDTDQLPFEFGMNALRLNDGFKLQTFIERTGCPATVLLARLQDSIDDGLLHLNGEHLQPTDSGRLYLNTILERLL